ncbi:hypothetical protein F2Q69_00049756 [Brassica cretica]|uniref:Uncharacterized protein n=1 Tax=Brassica cretica TaxID=69181 RepID=A0A8S9PJU5_BRACR|nr:hypothetical protein F2Q69_00049756 [Brassica cretica]
MADKSNQADALKSRSPRNATPPVRIDNVKEELMWEGSSVVMLRFDEQRFLEALVAYVA